MKIPIEVSARHIHLSTDDLTKLFGQGYELKELKKISQPKQFACVKTVEILGPKGKFDNVRIIGPVRSKTQLEVSVTDAYQLGIEPQVRISGDLSGTDGGVKVIGSYGQIDLHEGVIIAQRHLHIEPDKALKLGLKHNQIISIKTDGVRSIVFNNVVVRSRQDEDKLSFQIDIDEANAADLKSEDVGELIM